MISVLPWAIFLGVYASCGSIINNDEEFMQLVDSYSPSLLADDQVEPGALSAQHIACTTDEICIKSCKARHHDVGHCENRVCICDDSQALVTRQLRKTGSPQRKRPTTPRSRTHSPRSGTSRSPRRRTVSRGGARRRPGSPRSNRTRYSTPRRGVRRTSSTRRKTTTSPSRRRKPSRRPLKGKGKAKATKERGKGTIGNGRKSVGRKPPAQKKTPNKTASSVNRRPSNVLSGQGNGKTRPPEGLPPVQPYLGGITGSSANQQRPPSSSIDNAFEQGPDAQQGEMSGMSVGETAEQPGQYQNGMFGFEGEGKEGTTGPMAANQQQSVASNVGDDFGGGSMEGPEMVQDGLQGTGAEVKAGEAVQNMSDNFGLEEGGEFNPEFTQNSLNAGEGDDSKQPFSFGENEGLDSGEDTQISSGTQEPTPQTEGTGNVGEGSVFGDGMFGGQQEYESGEVGEPPAGAQSMEGFDGVGSNNNSFMTSESNESPRAPDGLMGGSVTGSTQGQQLTGWNVRPPVLNGQQTAGLYGKSLPFGPYGGATRESTGSSGKTAPMGASPSGDSSGPVADDEMSDDGQLESADANSDDPVAGESMEDEGEGVGLHGGATGELTGPAGIAAPMGASPPGHSSGPGADDELIDDGQLESADANGHDSWAGESMGGDGEGVNPASILGRSVTAPSSLKDEGLEAGDELELDSMMGQAPSKEPVASSWQPFLEKNGRVVAGDVSFIGSDMWRTPPVKRVVTPGKKLPALSPLGPFLHADDAFFLNGEKERQIAQPAKKLTAKPPLVPYLDRDDAVVLGDPKKAILPPRKRVEFSIAPHLDGEEPFVLGMAPKLAPGKKKVTKIANLPHANEGPNTLNSVTPEVTTLPSRKKQLTGSRLVLHMNEESVDAFPLTPVILPGKIQPIMPPHVSHVEENDPHDFDVALKTPAPSLRKKQPTKSQIVPHLDEEDLDVLDGAPKTQVLTVGQKQLVPVVSGLDDNNAHFIGGALKMSALPPRKKQSSKLSIVQDLEEDGSHVLGVAAKESALRLVKSQSSRMPVFQLLGKNDAHGLIVAPRKSGLSSKKKPSAKLASVFDLDEVHGKTDKSAPREPIETPMKITTTKLTSGPNLKNKVLPLVGQNKPPPMLGKNAPKYFTSHPDFDDDEDVPDTSDKKLLPLMMGKVRSKVSFVPDLDEEDTPLKPLVPALPPVKRASAKSPTVTDFDEDVSEEDVLETYAKKLALWKEESNKSSPVPELEDEEDDDVFETTTAKLVPQPKLKPLAKSTFPPDFDDEDSFDTPAETKTSPTAKKEAPRKSLLVSEHDGNDDEHLDPTLEKKVPSKIKKLPVALAAAPDFDDDEDDFPGTSIKKPTPTTSKRVSTKSSAVPEYHVDEDGVQVILPNKTPSPIRRNPLGKTSSALEYSNGNDDDDEDVLGTASISSPPKTSGKQSSKSQAILDFDEDDDYVSQAVPKKPAPKKTDSSTGAIVSAKIPTALESHDDDNVDDEEVKTLTAKKTSPLIGKKPLAKSSSALDFDDDDDYVLQAVPKKPTSTMLKKTSIKSPAVPASHDDDNDTGDRELVSNKGPLSFGKTSLGKSSSVLDFDDDDDEYVLQAPKKPTLTILKKTSMKTPVAPESHADDNDEAGKELLANKTPLSFGKNPLAKSSGVLDFDDDDDDFILQAASTKPIPKKLVRPTDKAVRAMTNLTPSIDDDDDDEFVLQAASTKPVPKKLVRPTDKVVQSTTFRTPNIDDDDDDERALEMSMKSHVIPGLDADEDNDEFETTTMMKKQGVKTSGKAG